MTSALPLACAAVGLNFSQTRIKTKETGLSLAALALLAKGQREARGIIFIIFIYNRFK